LSKTQGGKTGKKLATKKNGGDGKNHHAGKKKRREAIPLSCWGRGEKHTLTESVEPPKNNKKRSSRAPKDQRGRLGQKERWTNP